MPAPTQPPAKAATPQATPPTKQVGGGFGGGSSDEPIVPGTGQGGQEDNIPIPFIRPRTAEHPQPPQPEAGAGGTPPSEELDDELLLEMARRAASKDKQPPPAEPKAGSEPPTPPTGDPESPPPKSKDFNFAELRKALDFAKSEAETMRGQVAELTKLKEKETQFAAWEEEKKKLEAELQEAAPFRDLFAIQRNPTFRETYILPMDEIRQSLVKLATDYRAPDADKRVDALLAAESAKERNDILADLFADEQLPIDEARGAIQRFTRLATAKKQAEQAPKETLEKIRLAEQEAATLRANQLAQQAELATAAGFTNALKVNGGEANGIRALMEIPGNKQHNQTRQAILADSQNLHKQSIDHCLKHGAKISTGLSGWLAALCQMSGVANIALQGEAHYKKIAHDLAAELDKLRGYSKPGATTGPRSPSQVPPSGPPGTGMSSKQVAKTVWDQVTQESAVEQ